MKINLLVLLLFIGFLFGYSQNTYVPDDNFEQALIDLGYDSGPLDDYIPTASINTITILNVPSRNIVDLTGLENFTALETLRCYNNNLNGLNVTQNINLTHLYCDNSNLSSIDISQNSSLVQLYCSSNNLLNIDISQNIALEVLYCYNMNLSSINLSYNVNLERLRCDGNLLSHIDVSLNSNLDYIKCDNNNLVSLNVANGNNSNIVYFNSSLNPNLTCIEVDSATYSNTNWTNIDSNSSFSSNCSVNGFTYIPDDNFEQQLINLGYDSGALDDYVPTTNINSLLSIDLEDQDIADLTGIADFTALQILYCQTNQLTSMDLSSNTNLITLVCSGNLLTNLNLSQNVNLTHITCGNNQLSGLAIGNATILTELYISDNIFTNFDGSGLSSLIDFRCQNNQLTTLNIANGNNSNITYFNATNNPNLTCIQVDNAAYSTINWTNIDTASSFNTDCSNIGLTYVPDDNFEQTLIDLGYDSGVLDDYVPTANISSVTTLDVSFKNITSLTGIEDFLALTLLNCRNNQLTNLDVSSNILLNYIYCSDNQLTSLDLSTNTLLTYILCSDNQLTSLDLSNNILLTEIRCVNNLLSVLDVSVNTVLAGLFCSGNQLTYLNVANGNNINFTDWVNYVNFEAYANPNLTCIEVDDAAYSTANWTHIHPVSSYSENCGTASTEEFNINQNFLVYPNPVKDTLTIESRVNSAYQLVDCLGKIIRSGLVNIGENSIETTALSKGIYFVKINSEIERIIKQ